MTHEETTVRLVEHLEQTQRILRARIKELEHELAVAYFRLLPKEKQRECLEEWMNEGAMGANKKEHE